LALLTETKGYTLIRDWLSSRGYQPFAYQEETWAHILNGKSGLVNAPTGTGKTFSVFLGSLISFVNQYPDAYRKKKGNGLQLVWVTPLRALAKDIGRAMEEVLFELDLPWKVGIRNGDTTTSERQKQKRQMPEVLIITPESLHLLLGQKNYPEVFNTLKIFAVDEWHELVGSKRGVQVELAISRIVGLVKSRQQEAGREERGKEKKGRSKNEEEHEKKKEFPLSIWGISATIGNLEEAMEVLLMPLQLLGQSPDEGKIVRARLQKSIEVQSVLPDEIEKY